MGAYSDILAGMLGSVVRTILNKIGSDVQLSRRQVTSLAEVDNEINFYTTGTIITVDTGESYRYNGATWELVYLNPDVNYVSFNLGASIPAHQEGLIYWDTVEHTLAMMTEIDGTVLQIGQEFFIRCLNKTGSTIPNGTVVYVSGAQGNRPTLAPAIATNVSGDKVIGVATDPIENNTEGYVTIAGIVRSYDTSNFTEGDTLYLSDSVAGALQNTSPASPSHAVKVGVALNSTANGSIFVFVEIGGDISSLHDAQITSPVCGDVLKFDELTGVWINIQAHPISIKSSDYTIVRNTDDTGTILVQCSTVPITISLPDLGNSVNHSASFTIKKIDATANNVIISGNGYNIDGQPSITLTSQYDYVIVHSDSTAWWII